jgi:16S rRNA (adenine1518-N6/adenine1519-N6)-dimethyltransferase
MVKPKKYLGQHFLLDDNVAQKTAALTEMVEVRNWLEIGPGTGRLTQHLLKKDIDLEGIELDAESVKYLNQHFPELPVYEADFLNISIPDMFKTPLGIIGNFPYNISSQIVFKILDNVQFVPGFCGMFQLEVAQRLAAKPHNKSYGIISVLAQAWYDLSIELTIPPSAFKPPPKVQSAVILAKRHDRELGTDRKLFFDVVKTAFQQRRKMLSNALRKFNLPDPDSEHHHLLKLRAENLDVEQFVLLSNLILEKNG